MMTSRMTMRTRMTTTMMMTMMTSTPPRTMVWLLRSWRTALRLLRCGRCHAAAQSPWDGQGKLLSEGMRLCGFTAARV